MAEEKKVAVQEKTKNVPAKTEETKGSKFLAWCKNLPARIAKPFKNMWTELKRVTWPTKRKLIVYSAIVLVFMLCMGIIVGLFDACASALVMLFAKV